MSYFWCSSCHQFFAQEGFCPYDGTKLAVPPDALSSQPETVRAASASGGDHAQALAALASRASPKSDYDRLIGQTLDGRYFIERKIGEGGMGVVFAARHTVIERPLAIKVLKREVARDAATIKRFVQEAKAATRIGHPAIVDVTDFGTTPDGMTYSVMEYVDGTTLAQAIKRNSPMPLPRAVPIIAQIARALAAAHEKGIVHRDLKPENVFLVNRENRRDFVKIVDFGIAKVTPIDGQQGDGPRLTRAGAVFGTPEYMAPEQAAGRPDTDHRVDVYALATILYEMMTGRVPHKSDSMVRTLAMQMLDPIEPPTKVRPDLKISPELERVVMKGLAKKRDERYPNMADFVTDLSRACPDIPVDIPAPQSDGPLQLVPAPPGADLRVLSGQRTIDDGGAPLPVRATPEAVTQQRGRTPPGVPKPRTEDLPTTPHGEGPRATSKRVANEPRFVTSQRPHTFDHVFDEDAEAVKPRAKWPLLILLVVLATAGGVAVALVMRGGSSNSAVSRNDTPDARDEEDVVVTDAPRAPVVTDGAVVPVIDGAVVVDVPIDAGEGPPPPDARRGGGGNHKRDAGPGRRIDAGYKNVTPRGTIQVQVISKPSGATVYVNDSYRGVDGVTLEEDPGARVKVKCTLPGYDPDIVSVTFDGDREVILCRPQRPKRCVDSLHNPFDDCPDPEPPE